MYTIIYIYTKYIHVYSCIHIYYIYLSIYIYRISNGDAVSAANQRGPGNRVTGVEPQLSHKWVGKSSLGHRSCNLHAKGAAGPLKIRGRCSRQSA